MLLHFILSVLTVSVTMVLGSFQGITSRATINNVAKPNCSSHCGNVIVPYPFGIGKETGCALDDSFYVNCSTSEKHKTPKLFLRSSSFEILNISDSELRIKNFVSYKCYNQYGIVYGTQSGMLGLESFTYSEKNKFTVIGCDDYALIRGMNGFSSGCIGVCSKGVVVPDGHCSGKGCCQTSITKGLRYYDVILNTFRNHSDVWSFNYCGIAFLGEGGTFQFRGSEDLSNSTKLYDRIMSTVPVVLDWVIGYNRTCSGATECKAHSHCNNVDGGGYRCKCDKGYEGNPYLDQGCQDINECEDPIKYTCYGNCTNIVGSYNCTCPVGSSGDAKTKNGCQPIAKDSKLSSTIFVTAMVLTLLAILCGIGLVSFCIRRRKLTMLRERFFEQNGGVLLKQKMSSQRSHDVGNKSVYIL